MERAAARTSDLEQSIMVLCDNNALEYTAILNGPATLYEAKLKYWAEMHKPDNKEKQNGR